MNTSQGYPPEFTELGNKNCVYAGSLATRVVRWLWGEFFSNNGCECAVGLRHLERTSHIHPMGRPVCRADCSSLGLGSHNALSDTLLALAASNVDEALAEIECHRELIAALTRWGQPTEAAELALESMIRQFAYMIEQEHGILAAALQTKGMG